MASLFLYGYPRMSDDDVGLADGGVASADGVATATPSADPILTFEPGKEPLPAGYPGNLVPNAATTELLKDTAVSAAKVAAKTGLRAALSWYVTPLVANAATDLLHDYMPDLEPWKINLLNREIRKEFRSQTNKATNKLFASKMVRPARGQRNWGKTRVVRSTGANRRASGRTRPFRGGYRRYHRSRMYRPRGQSRRYFRRRRYY
jgi:hypothetical protein